MDEETPLRLVAEVQWGISLVLYEQAYKRWNEAENGGQQDQLVEKKEFLKLMQQSLDYAEKACTMYMTINELSRSALMNCQIALIEQGMKNLDAARLRLQKVLDDWLPTWRIETSDNSPDIAEKVKRYSVKERANIVSAAACYLASIELDAKQCDAALKHVDLALEAAQDSYTVRRADAYMTKGQILAARDDSEAIVAYRQALTELEHTQRLAAKIRVHYMLGAYLIKLGNEQAGKAEQDVALSLANVPMQYQATTDEGDKNAGGNPLPLSRGRTFHEQLVRGDDAPHLVLITAPIGVVFLSEFAIAAFNLLARRIRWQSQHRQRLLPFHNGPYRIGTAAP